MWSYGLDLRSIKLTVVKVVVSSEGTYNNSLFVEAFNWFLVTKYLIFLQTICDFQIFVCGDFVTNAKVYQGFRDGKKIEKHCSTFNTSSDIFEKKTQSSSEQ